VKIPHLLFRIVNMVMIMLLRSPLHAMFDSSILAIRYTGIKTGRRLSVPARYVRRGDVYLLVTSRQGKWWPNFVDGLAAQVLIAGDWRAAQIEAFPDAPEFAAEIMRELWSRHPADAAYMNVKMRDGVPDSEDFETAVRFAVVIRVATA